MQNKIIEELNGKYEGEIEDVKKNGKD